MRPSEAHTAGLAPLATARTSYVRTGSETSYHSWTGFPRSHRAPLTSSVTSAPSSDAIHTPDTSGIGPDVPWSSTRTHSIGSSGRSVLGVTGGPKTGCAAPDQPLRTPVRGVPPHPRLPLSAPQVPPTGFNTSSVFDDSNGDGPDLDEEVSEAEDDIDEAEDNHDDDNVSEAAGKAKGKRGKAPRPGGLAIVSYKESQAPRTTRYKLFEDGEIINWLCSPEAPIEWIDEAFLPDQSKARPKPVFQKVSRISNVFIPIANILQSRCLSKPALSYARLVPYTNVSTRSG
jgi:hypothetical protein